jgi:hypothetical protein
MEAEGIATSAISAFESTFQSLVSGNTGLIPESTISPAPDLVESENFTGDADTSYLSKTVVLKLNGGLGTGMGLDKAKSLLTVKGNDTFLDLTAKQIIEMRKEFGMKVKFMLMNSFSTSEDTLNFFKENYPELAAEDGLEMMQNKVPKLDAETLEVCVLILRCVLCASFFIYLINKLNSLPHVPLTHPTNGALPVTEIYTPLWKDQDASMHFSRTDTNTCSVPTLIT